MILRALVAQGMTFCMLAAPALAQNAPSTPPAVDADYLLGSGDKIRLIVFGEDNLGGEYVVDGAGFVRLPLIGQVRAGGLAIRQFENEIVAAFRREDYLKNPRVSIEVTNYRPFYIIGEVNKPGEYPYVNSMTVLNAVAMAGGFTYRANERYVYVRRNGKGEEQVPADGTVKVRPGDIVRVTERFF
jgi:protein involved in polysaccharide export with SLBB domain